MSDVSAMIMKKKRNTIAIVRREFALYTLVVPAVIFTILFAYLPMFINVIAFMDYDLFAGWLGLGSPFVGFKWFLKFLRDPFFYEVVGRTLYYSAVKLVFAFPAPIVLALLLNEVRSNGFKRVTQTLSYLPHFVSWVTVSSLVYIYLSSSSYGLINNIIEALGGQRRSFMSSSSAFLPILVITDIWKEVGWGAIIYIAAIASIDQEMYDAVKIDGAGRWRQMLYVTLPGIMPATMILLILTMGGVFSANFDQLFTLQNEVIREQTYVINVYAYFEGIFGHRYSLGTAISLFQGLVNFILIWTTNLIVKRVRGVGLF